MDIDYDSDVEMVQAGPSKLSSMPYNAASAGGIASAWPPVPMSEVIEIDDDDDDDEDTPPPPFQSAYTRVGFASANDHGQPNSRRLTGRANTEPSLHFASHTGDSDDGDDLPDIRDVATRGLNRSASDTVTTFSRTTYPPDKGKQRALSTILPSSPPRSRVSSSGRKPSSKNLNYENLSDSSRAEAEAPAKKKQKAVAKGSNSNHIASTSYDLPAPSLTAKERKELEKAEKAAAKDKAKAEKATLLAQEKAQKNAMKASNKLGNRNETPQELTLDISKSLLEDKIFKDKVYYNLAAACKEMQCTYPTPEQGRTSVQGCYPKTIHWRREVRKDWDAAGRFWIPRNPAGYTMEEEKSVLLYLSVQDVEDAVQHNSLVDIVTAIQDVHGYDCQVFLLIQNLNDKGKAKTAAINAEFQNQARGTVQPKRKDKFSSSVTFEQIEMELIKIQVALQQCFVVRAETYEQASDWLVELTKDISFRPYKRIERERESILNIDGKIEANKGSLQATYINQLKCIHQLTDAGAVGIARRYPSWSRLLQAYRNCRTLQEKYDLLEDIPVPTKVNGAATDKVIGKTLSERIYVVLFTDDGSLDLTGDIKALRSRVGRQF